MLPFELSKIVKQPSTCAESKYFLRPLSILALFTEHDAKPEIYNNKIKGKFFFIKKKNVIAIIGIAGTLLRHTEIHKIVLHIFL